MLTLFHHLMGRRPSAWSVCLAILSITFFGLFSSQPLLAATTPGADPDHPLFPSETWMTLANGASHWYAFRDEGDGAPIVVRLTVLPEHQANFAVITPSAVRQWELGEPFTAVGEGTPIKLFPNELYWTGSFVQSGTYYVLVRSNGQESSSYRLTIDGPDVSFPLLSFSQATDPRTTAGDHYPKGENLPTPLPILPDVTATAVPPLSSAENPLPPIGKSMTITTNEVHWYAFRDEGDASTIQVSADATPDQCLSFQVWTPEQLLLWQRGEEFRPVGEGTANPSLRVDLFWAGSFVKSGVYYVVVRHNPVIAGACTYKLLVLGDDVSLVMPATP